MAYRMQKLLLSSQVSLLYLANLSIVKSTVEDIPLQNTSPEIANYSDADLRFSFIHRSSISTPLVLTLNDLKDASTIDDFKQSWINQIDMKESSQENISLLKLYIKAREDLYDCLISQKPTVHVHEAFFKQLASVKSSSGLGTANKEIRRGLQEFISEVL